MRPAQLLPRVSLQRGATAPTGPTRAFNMCACWGWTLFTSVVVIPLRAADAYKDCNWNIFPEIAGLVIFFQLRSSAAVILGY